MEEKMKKMACFAFILFLVSNLAYADLSKKMAILRVGTYKKCGEAHKMQWEKFVKPIVEKKGISYYFLPTPKSKVELLATVKKIKKIKTRVVLMSVCTPVKFKEKIAYRIMILVFLIKNNKKNSFDAFAQLRAPKNITDVKKRLRTILRHAKKYLASKTYHPKTIFNDNKATPIFSLGFSTLVTYDFKSSNSARVAFGVVGKLDLRRCRLLVAAHGGFPFSNPALILFVSVKAGYAVLHNKWKFFSLWLYPFGYQARILFSKAGFKQHGHRVPIGFDVAFTLFAIKNHKVDLTLGVIYPLGIIVKKSNVDFSYSDVQAHARLTYQF